MKPFLYFTGFVIFLFLVLFMPYDWWQKPPAKQPDKLIGKILPFLNISIRNILLRAFFLGFMLLIYLLSIIWVPIIAGIVITGAILRSVYLRIRGRAAEPVTGLIMLLVIGSIFIIGIIAPLRTVPIAGYLLLGKPAGNFWEAMTVGKGWMTMDGIIGLCGIFGVASWMLLDAVWRFRQARQVENLATSKIGALGMGLVEIQGKVRPVSGIGAGSVVELNYSMFDYLKPEQRISKFMLDDGTGTVLVDATECRVRAGWISEVASIFGVREIVLTRRITRDEFTDGVRKTLEFGDKVYVIGNAERAQSGDLVLRPASRPGWNEVLWKTLFGAVKPPKGRDIHDAFFITDGDEKGAKQHILKGFRTVLSWGLIWIISSVAVIWTAQQPWRQAPPPDSWRSAYWRGPEPNPNPMVLDYTRNDRLFRFEKYIKTVGPESYNQIPALIEAMAYKDYRFYEPAMWALIKMKPKVKGMAGEVVPILVSHLHSCSYNAKALQATILALGRFGPDAEEAVPALVDQLKCEKTDTYEVTPNIIRWQAARVLGEIGPQAREAIPDLTKALNDSSAFVRDAARQAIWKIGKGSASEDQDKKKGPSWIRLPRR
ncbi:MAG: HEAT repeat domain-containing protein [Nitrospirae bacterium]|nr:HEAT repeat domain-containing protein [Nitrospirota bacterium]